MIPLSRAASSTEAELGVRPRDNKTTRQHDWSPVVSSPASVDPPNNRQRITASRGAATISAFQHLPRRSSTKAGFSLSVFSTSAFTLIEMIVVMLIIATLTALFMGAASSVFDRARRTQAKNDVIQIATAVNAFYTEYGRYPVTVTDPTKDAFFGTGSTPAGSNAYGTNVVLLNVLRNITTDPNAVALNPRQIVFLSPGGAKNTVPPRGGIATADNCYYDPWGSQYAIVIDTNYDNTITNPYSDSDGSAGTTPLHFGAVAYSYGKNGALGGGSASSPYTSEGGSAGVFKGSSDILSW
jgi:prepilin-type N-terminal cleavage/methylation domain-containing protein